MNTFSLNSRNSQIEFRLNSIDSYLYIDTITLINFNEISNEWINILSKVELKAELKYLVYSDSNGPYLDIRSSDIPIYFDPAQSQPVFKINRTIQNQLLTIGINSETKFYSTLKLELKETGIIPETYELRFEVRPHEFAKAIN